MIDVQSFYAEYTATISKHCHSFEWYSAQCLWFLLHDHIRQLYFFNTGVDEDRPEVDTKSYKWHLPSTMGNKARG